MTNLELNNEFDIHYNSIAGQSAPNLDAYEKSVFLTKAQLELVKNYYDPQSNRKQKGFEASEKRREDLKELIKNYNDSNSFDNSTKIHSSSRFFNIPEDVFLIINEQVEIKSEDCFNGNTIEVKPVTHDEFNKQIKNPFKTPDETLAWRLDYSSINDNKVVEIISPYNITGSLTYKLRYLKYPEPIILTDLSVEFPGENLSVDGMTGENSCKLNESLHREILDRAIQLALRDYKPEGLESKIQLDTRNE